MSWVTTRFLIGYILLQTFLVQLRGVCADDYDHYATFNAEVEICGLNMECVPPHICIGGNISSGGETVIGFRTDCSSGKICCRRTPENDSEEDEEGKTLSIADGCGYLNRGGISPKPMKVSEQAEFGEFPWMLVILSNHNLGKYFGGASLIHPKIALTAAHIVDGKRAHKIAVRAGEWTSKSQTEPLPHQDRSVLEIVMHEDYDKNTLFNDIALLFLRDAFEMKPHINTVCLPPTGSSHVGGECFATGWGVSARNKKTPDFLKKISLGVVRNSRCQRLLRRTYLRVFFELHDSFMCAGGVQEADTCDGDGGSPLVCPIQGKEGRYQQVGIVSWGLEGECGRKDIPAVYANTARLRNWVDVKVAAKGFNSSTYVAA